MLKLIDVTKTYRTVEVETTALSRISLDVRAGEFLAIMGPSGCGKSTLLNMLGLLDSPSSGKLFFQDKDISRASERALTLLRRAHIGFVFQNFNLIEISTSRRMWKWPSSIAAYDPRNASDVSPPLWIAWVSPPAPAICRTSFPAASSSASPSPALWWLSHS